MKELTRQQLASLLCQRMSKADAMEIVEEVLFHLESDAKLVATSDIFTLCITSDEFCIFMKKFTLSDGTVSYTHLTLPTILLV